MTSTTGAKSIVTPRFRMSGHAVTRSRGPRPGVLVCASTLADGWSADQVGQPRHSAALLVDAHRQWQRVRRCAMSDRRPHHRQVVQLPIMIPPTWWVSMIGAARASSAPVTPTINSRASLSRVRVLGEQRRSVTACGRRGAGRGWPGTLLDPLGAGDASGFSVAGEHATEQAGDAASTTQPRTRQDGHGPHVTLAAWTGSWCPLRQASLSACCWARPPSSGNNADDRTGHQAATAGRRSGVVGC